MDPSLQNGLEAIHVSPMLQSKPWRHGEDWTGTTNPQLRRKLQNRINQRAKRARENGIRRNGYQSSPKGTSQLEDIPSLAIQVTSTRSGHAEMDVSSISQARNVIPKDRNSFRSSESAEQVTTSATLTITTKQTSNPCITPSTLRSIMVARDFNNWLAYYRKRAITPFSADHLLTLMFFNVVRAHHTNTALLGLTADDLAADTISPFNIDSTLAINLPKAIPPTFYPTEIQKTIPHHPDSDMMPWPQVRDNMILAQGTYDDYEFCEDMVGVRCSFDEVEWVEEGTGERKNLRTVDLDEPKHEPGLIIWSDPWKASSWEASEAFVRKWGWLLVGCKELLESTNYWRQQRGEERLVNIWEV